MKAIWDQEAAEIEKAANEYIDSKIQERGKFNPVNTTFYENIKKYVMRGGKRLRPLLIVCGYKAVKEEVEIKHLYRVSLSLEFLHNGSLLHDDLIDHDETRRGGPTFHVIYREWYKQEVLSDQVKAEDFGMSMAILGGDSLINTGSLIITTSELPADVAVRCLRYYVEGFQDLVDGVVLEMGMIQDPTTTPETYLQMVRMKTAVLFEKALQMGAVMAGGTESQIESLGTFGLMSGQAFQVQDDILGTFGDETVTGKPTDGDIREGKKTMLVIQAYKLASPEQKQVLDDLLGKDEMTTEEVENVRQVFRDCGAFETTQNIMNEFLESAQNALDSTEPPLTPKYKEFLIELSNFLVERTY